MMAVATEHRIGREDVIWSFGPSFVWPRVHVCVTRIVSRPASFRLSISDFANA